MDRECVDHRTKHFYGIRSVSGLAIDGLSNCNQDEVQSVIHSEDAAPNRKQPLKRNL